MREGSAPLDVDYLDWLYSEAVGMDERRSYYRLFSELHRTPFVWTIPNDENRASEGRELRYLYDLYSDSPYFDNDPGDASVLEVMCALAIEAGFDSDEAPGFWMMKFIHNLELDIYDDNKFRSSSVSEEIHDKVNTFMLRRYQEDGLGGLFPLMHPREDQRDVELWYQMSSYIIENSRLFG